MVYFDYKYMHPKDIVKNNKNDVNIKKWKSNKKLLSTDLMFFVSKTNLFIYIILFVLSLAIIIPCSFDDKPIYKIFLSIGCGILSSVLVAYFIDLSSNITIINKKVTDYNYDLFILYNSFSNLSCHVELSKFAIRNYAGNYYKKEHPELTMEQCDSAIEELFKKDYNEIPIAKACCQFSLNKFIDDLSDVINTIKSFFSKYNHLIDKLNFSLISQNLSELNNYLVRLNEYDSKLIAFDIKTFDNIVLKSRELENNDLIIHNYMYAK